MPIEASRTKYVLVFIFCNLTSSLVARALSWLLMGIFQDVGQIETPEIYAIYSFAVVIPAALTWIVTFKIFEGVYFSRVVRFFLILSLVSGLLSLGYQAELARQIGFNYSRFAVWDVASGIAYVAVVLVYFFRFDVSHREPPEYPALTDTAGKNGPRGASRFSDQEKLSLGDAVKSRKEQTGSQDIATTKSIQFSGPKPDTSLRAIRNNPLPQARSEPARQVGVDRIDLILKYDPVARECLNRLQGF